MRNVTFEGMLPKITPQSLPTNAAVYAANCLLHGGMIRPIMQAAGHSQVVDTNYRPLKDVVTMRPLSGLVVGWDHFTEHTLDVLKRAGEDSFLFVENGELYRGSTQWTVDGLGAVKLGVCPPKQAPIAIVTGECGPLFKVDDPACLDSINDKNCNEEKDSVYLAFCYTYVTACQEESQPSPFSAPVLITSDKGIFLTSPERPPSNATEVRWYVLLSADGTSHPFYIGSTAPGAGIDYCYSMAQVGEILQSQTYSHPPPCLQGVAVVGEATTLVWHGNQIWLSEPRQPHAYPEAFRFTLDPGIIIRRALTMSGSTEGRPYWYVILLTNDTPYLVQGAKPEEVVITRVMRQAPCINPAGVVVHQEKVFFASDDGVMVMSVGSIANITAGILDSRSWEKYKSQHLVLGVYDNRLIGLRPDQNGFMLGLSEPDSAYQKDFVEVTYRGCAGAQHYKDFLFTASAGYAEAWEQGTTPMVAEWRSKDYVQSGLWHGTAAKVVSTERADVVGQGKEHLQQFLRCKREGRVRNWEQYIIQHPDARVHSSLLTQSIIDFTVYNDGTEYYSRPIITNRAVRLKRSNRRIVWGYGVRTQVPIVEIHIQTSKDDLTQEGGHG